MKFQPRSLDEIAIANLLPEGEYDFTVLEAENATSKSGNEMIKIKLCVFSDQKDSHIFDYLLASFERKFRRACECLGLLDLYNKGEIDAEDFKGRSGKCKIGIKKQDDYDPKNEVKDYIVDRSFKAPEPLGAKVSPSGDNIPF